MIALVGTLDTHIVALTTGGGYQFPQAFNATLAHWRFLCYPGASVRTYHLHLVDEPEELERLLRFRDRLRSDAALAREDVTLKRAPAARHRDDRAAYTQAKAQFIQASLQAPGAVSWIGRGMAAPPPPASWRVPSPPQAIEGADPIHGADATVTDFWRRTSPALRS